MKFTGRLLLVLTLGLASISAQAATKAEDPRLYSQMRVEYDNFLKALGFEDYSAMARETLESGNVTNKTALAVLEFNAKRYEIINYARRLTTAMIEHVQTMPLDDKRYREKISFFTARMLALKPFEPPSSFPEYIFNLPEKEAEKEKLKYATEVTIQNIRNHTHVILSDLGALFFTREELQQLMKLKSQSIPENLKPKWSRFLIAKQLIEKIVETIYLDAEVGQTKYLGRAFLAALTKFSMENNRPEIMESIRKMAERNNLELDNFIGDKVVFVNNKGQREVMDLQDGDIIMERSIGTEAGEITFGARPNWRLYLNGYRNNLLGGFLDSKVPPEGDGSKELSTMDSIKYNVSKAAFFTRGISHVGVATVLQDIKTGIKMTWALDNYPNRAEGGLRIIGIAEQFATPGTYMRFARVRYNAENFYRWAKKQVYNDTAWAVDEEIVDKDGNSKKGKKISIATMLSQEEFNQFMSEGETNPHAWFKNYNRRLTQFMRINMMAKEQALGFAYGFSNYIHRAYCTLTIIMASRMANGLDMQMHHDSWNVVVKIMKAFKLEKLNWLELTDRIVAPAGMAWQPRKYIEKFDVVTYPQYSYSQRRDFLTHPVSIPDKVRFADKLRYLFGRPNTSRLKGELESGVLEAIEGDYHKRRKSEQRSGNFAEVNALTGYTDLLVRNFHNRWQDQDQINSTCSHIFR